MIDMENPNQANIYANRRLRHLRDELKISETSWEQLHMEVVIAFSAGHSRGMADAYRKETPKEEEGKCLTHSHQS